MLRTIPSKKSKYRGVRFRSTLESRYAEFFDYIGWRWEYEPFFLKNYLPDFIVKFPCGIDVLLEIKPWDNAKDLIIDASSKLWKSGWNGAWCIFGTGNLGTEDISNPCTVSPGVVWSNDDDWDDGYNQAQIIQSCKGCKKISIGIFQPYGFGFICLSCGHVERTREVGLAPYLDDNIVSAYQWLIQRK